MLWSSLIFFLQVSVQIKWTLIFLANLKKGFDVHKKYHLHCQQEKARHELSVSKDYGNIMPYILQETPANFICISMHFSSFVCIKNRTKWIASKKRNRINNRYVFCCNKRWRHLSVPFCGLKIKVNPDGVWLLVLYSTRDLLLPSCV